MLQYDRHENGSHHGDGDIPVQSEQDLTPFAAGFPAVLLQ
jgi:hypothetical protein